jgi:hypothetical protein
MASAGTGTPPHVTGELLKMMTGVNMTHVPYRGGAPAIIDLLGGQVQVYFAGMAESIEYIRAGKLRALAVTWATRWEALPEVPTVGEFLQWALRPNQIKFSHSLGQRLPSRQCRDRDRCTPVSRLPLAHRASWQSRAIADACTAPRRYFQVARAGRQCHA